MSAYIVSNETMNRVVSTIMRTCREFGQRCTYSLGGREFDRVASEIGRDLFALNARAVVERYGGTADMAPFRFHYILPRKPAAELKSLHCLIYQCSEGAVMNDPLYRDLEKLCGRISDEIIANMPDYQAAPWG
jgi:hypothetical protein